MNTRYRALREMIQVLASDAEVQAAWLDDFFSDLVGGGSAEDFGNSELLLCFDDIFIARYDMLDRGELKQEEVVAAEQLNQLIAELHPNADDTFWDRKALSEDQRWEHIRKCAVGVLASFPDETRESEWTKKNWGGGGSKALPAN